MKWLIGMEYSGAIREAFRRIGLDATSCDFLPSDDNSNHHIQGDVFDEIRSEKYDAAILHPSCTYLTCSGEKWYNDDADKFNPAETTVWGGGSAGPCAVKLLLNLKNLSGSAKNI